MLKAILGFIITVSLVFFILPSAAAILYHTDKNMLERVIYSIIISFSLIKIYKHTMSGKLSATIKYIITILATLYLWTYF